MKNLAALLITASVLSCNQPKQENAATAPITDSPNQKLVSQYFEHFNKHEWDKLAAMYTDIADFKDPTLGSGIVKQTRAETAKKYTELNGVFGDIKDSVIASYPSGENHVVVEFVSTGTAPDGTRLNLPICTIFTFEDGLISKDFTYYDDMP